MREGTPEGALRKVHAKELIREGNGTEPVVGVSADGALPGQRLGVEGRSLNRGDTLEEGHRGGEVKRGKHVVFHVASSVRADLEVEVVDGVEGVACESWGAGRGGEGAGGGGEAGKRGGEVSLHGKGGMEKRGGGKRVEERFLGRNGTFRVPENGF